LSAAVPVVLGAFVRTQRGGAELLNQVFSIVATRAVDSLPADSVYVKAARGLVDGLNDPYAEFYTPKEIKDFMRNSIGNAYGGLGMAIILQGRGVVINDVFPGSPAARGGAQRGDQIMAIDGVPTTGWTTDNVSQHLTGAIGTTVKVSLGKPGVAEPVVTTFTRGEVHASAVPYVLLLKDSIGYIPLQRFNNTAGAEVDHAVASLRTEGARRFVIDLRGNGGGDVDQAVAVSNLFLKTGAEVATQRERGGNNKVYVAKSVSPYPTEPLAVLIDQGTASASEIVAGALQDHDRAVILGSTSFGKGLVQGVYDLDGGYALKLTTGKWYTPSGRSIHRDRKLVDGVLTLVDTTTDTMAAHAHGPETHSDAGRVLIANGGITPDVTIAAEPLTSGDERFSRAVGTQGAAVRNAIYELARDQRDHVPANFTVTPTLRDSLYVRLTAAGLTVDRPAFDAGSNLIDRLLERQTLQIAFGDSAAVLRSIPTDPVMTRALGLLGKAHSESDVYAGIHS
jgi:carboxyl-terminal processing protease